LVNQRIVGEIHLDDFLISHTKNQILWQSDELELVEEELFNVFADYRHIAQTRRVRDQGGPTEQAQAVALDQIKEIVSDPDFINLVTLNEVPAPELVEATLKPLRDAVQTGRPDATYVFGELTVKLFLDANKSSNDPYFIGDYTHENLVSVCINTQHPFWQDNIRDAQDLVIYLLNCMYDAIAEWKCMQQTGDIRPDTVKIIKDGLMRETFQRL